MNDQLEKSLVAIIEKASSSVEEGSVFLQGQLPSVVEELLRWKLISSCFAVVVGAIFVISWIVCCRSGYRAKAGSFWKEAHGDFTAQAFAIIFAGGLISGAASIFVIFGILSSLQILFAPKIYLIEYASSLIK